MKELFSVTTKTGIEAKFDSLKEAIQYTIFLNYLEVEFEMKRVESYE